MATSLGRATVEELKAELERRTQVPSSRPVAKGTPDFTAVIKMAETEVDRIDAGEHPNDDFKQYVFEGVMTAIYGDQFWVWWNGVIR